MTLEYCSFSNVFNGTWKYDQLTPLNNNPYNECPHFVSNVLNVTRIRDYYNKYSCVGKPYLKAKYETNNCSLLSLKSSIKMIKSQTRKSHQKQIVFVGDSLMSQVFISASCYLDSNLHQSTLSTKVVKHPTNSPDSFIINYPTFLNVTYILDLFLRTDYPCEPECLGANSTFRDSMLKSMFSACYACPYGIVLSVILNSDLF